MEKEQENTMSKLQWFSIYISDPELKKNIDQGFKIMKEKYDLSRNKYINHILREYYKLALS